MQRFAMVWRGVLVEALPPMKVDLTEEEVI